MTPDCRTCGACCASPERETPSIVDLEPQDLARMSRRTVRLHVVREHIQTAWKDQRAGPFAGHRVCACSALRGSIMSRVSCRIYEERPDVCREFEPGSKRCLDAMREAERAAT